MLFPSVRGYEFTQPSLRRLDDYRMCGYVHVQGGADGHGVGLLDLDSGHSTTCLLVLGQMGAWLNWLCNMAEHSNSNQSTQPRSTTTTPTLYVQR